MLRWNDPDDTGSDHGLAIDDDGLVRQLDMDVSGPEELQPAYAKAIASIPLTGKRDE